MKGKGPSSAELRQRLLTDIPVIERRLQIAGVSTALLEGGEGPPLVLLHGPGEHTVKWLRILPDLVTSYRVLAPDLPGHGSSEADEDSLEASQVLAWLGELIDETCASPPVLVGQILGGAIAARFASTRSDELDRLVLVDTLGLGSFEPAPEFGRALHNYIAEPNAETHNELWTYCAHDLDGLQKALGQRWPLLATYNLDRARVPGVRAALQTLMGQFAFSPIPPEELERITAPTSLIWGRHDLATRLAVAEAASERYGWPLHVIDDCGDDPPLERPEAFLRVLREVVAKSSRQGKES